MLVYLDNTCFRNYIGCQLVPDVQVLLYLQLRPEFGPEAMWQPTTSLCGLCNIWNTPSSCAVFSGCRSYVRMGHAIMWLLDPLKVAFLGWWIGGKGRVKHTHWPCPVLVRHSAVHFCACSVVVSHGATASRGGVPFLHSTAQ